MTSMSGREDGAAARLAGAEERGADAHRGRAEPDRGLEVGAHAHREAGKAVAGGDLGGEREVGAWRLVVRRNAHQAFERQAEFVPASADEGVGALWNHARLLRLLAG